MFKRLLGDVKDGRLQRLPYLGSSILLFVLMMMFILAIIFSIGIGEKALGGDLQQAQETLRDWFSIPFLIIFCIVMTVLLFAKLNIMAKRLRDIGFSGWGIVAAILVINALVGIGVSKEASSSVTLLVWLLLLFLPTNMLTKRNEK
jgi:uncharacterized membrane protein YhaH (DUF805 family)